MNRMTIKSLKTLVILVAQLALGSLPASAAPWQRYADPAQAGFSSEKLDEARKFADRAGSTAVVAVYKGKVIAAWGEVERPCEIHSVRKSIFCGLFGIHAAAGKVDLNATLEQLGIDDDPPLTAAEKQATVVDLLRARSGVYHTAAKEPDDMKRERPARGSHAPGESFFYNNWDFNTLGPILEKAIGRTVAEELYEKLVTPLGMEDFRPEHAGEQLEPSNSVYPAYDFRISARDLARYGQLMNQGGEWNGTRIIPEAWVKESTSLQSKLPRGEGYGYMWWVHPKGSLGANYPALDLYDKFAARGTGGQFLLVIPDADFVFAHTVDTESNRNVRGPNVWRIAEMILAARTKRASSDSALTELHPIRFSNPPPAPKDHAAIKLTPAMRNAVVGEYALEPQMHVRVFEFQERLFANLRGIGEAEMFAETQSRFFIKADGTVIDFLTDPSGKVTVATFDMAGKSHTFPRTK